MARYEQIEYLHELLNKYGINHEFIAREEGYQIICRDKGKLVCSILETPHSMGNEADLLGMYGLLTEREKRKGTKVGYLTASMCFRRIQHYRQGTRKVYEY